LWKYIEREQQKQTKREWQKYSKKVAETARKIAIETG
jgi:hypothetical protein